MSHSNPVLALYFNRIVEVIDATRYPDGIVRAEIRPQDGGTFTRYSMGGGMDQTTITVRAHYLQPVTECSCVVPEQACPACVLAARFAYAEECAA